MSFAILFDYQKSEIYKKKKKKRNYILLVASVLPSTKVLLLLGRDVPSGCCLTGSWEMGTLQAMWQSPGTEK